MNKIIYYIALCMAPLFISCGGPNPTREEMVGKWVGGNGAEVNISSDGRFTGKHFPFKKFFVFIKPQDSTRTEFDGGGKWVITKDGSYWKVKLDFDASSVPGYLCVSELLVGGKKGILENKPPWYLYYWVEEEGGERFEFLKK
jgi:hypothetical protein